MRGIFPFKTSILVSRRVLPYRTNLQLTATFLAKHKIAADSSKQLGDCTLHVIWQVQKVYWKISTTSVP
jgi:hypothetical protein